MASVMECLTLLQCLQYFERFGDMLLSGKLCGEDVADNTLPVDNVGYAAWQQSKGRVDAVALSDGTIGITQQDKRETMSRGKLLV